MLAFVLRRLALGAAVLALALPVVPASAQTGPPCWSGSAFQLCPQLKHGDLNNAQAYAIQQGSAQALAALGTATAPAAVEKTVFIGSVQAGYLSLLNPALHQQLLSAGNVGLYQHANGNVLMTPAQRSTLWSVWGGTGVTPTGQGTTLGEVGPFAPVPSSYLAYFGGAYPAAVNMNISYGQGATPNYTAGPADAAPGTLYTLYMSSSDLAAAKGQFDAAIAAGAKNVAAYVTPNAAGMDLDDAFAISPYWAPIRTLALYGGGLALDVPPTYWVLRGPAYQSMIAQMIQWCQARGLRSNVTVTGYAAVADTAGHTGTDGYDPAFFANLQLMVTTFQLQNAMPSQWVVENYGSPNTSGNDIAADGARNDLTAAALYLARAVRTSPSGTTPAVANGIADAGLMVSTTTAPTVRAALPTTVRVGRFRMSDIDGLGTLAADDRDNVNIIGGSITGPVSIDTSRSVSARAGLDGGRGNAVILPSGLLLGGGATSAQLTATGGFVRVSPTAGVGGIVLPGVTVAGLPTSCLSGSQVFASNARNAGEAAGAGNGGWVTCGSDHVWRYLGAPVTY